jgi:hypothetical protein
MTFKVLFFKEHVTGEPNIIDSQVIILYDPTVETFFYYGTRKLKKNNEFVTYKGEFHYTRMYTLANLLKYTFGAFCGVVTHELHYIHISEDEYFDLDFHILREKISRSTEISAYDRSSIDIHKLGEMLDMLISHEV